MSELHTIFTVPLASSIPLKSYLNIDVDSRKANCALTEENELLELVKTQIYCLQDPRK